ncbi:MAG TPA: ABC transporter permease [Anaerolineaceae bacterium]|nr:ABC transporter permease [Anaerolineaceae bacterium]
MNRRRSSYLATVFSFIVVIILLAPIIISVAMSFTTSDTLGFPPVGFGLKWYQAVISEAKWQDRLPVSITVAVLSSLISTSIGTLAAFALVRSKIRGSNLISTLFIAPMIVPAVVLATGMYFVWAKGWSLGAIVIGGKLVGTITGLVLADIVIAIPLPFILVRASLANLDKTLELAAKNLGASPVTTFMTITFPLILPGILSGLIFAFMTSWDEVVIASFLSSPRVSTVPVAIFQQLRETLDPSAAAISSMLLLVGIILVSLLSLTRRKPAEIPEE